MFSYIKKHRMYGGFSLRKRKSSLSARCRNTRLNFETLEHRCMLGNGPSFPNEVIGIECNLVCSVEGII